MELKFQTYGQERERIATESELEIFDYLQDIAGGCLQLVRVTDYYLSAKFGDWDITRIKYTPRAKWLMFPTIEPKQIKHRIEDPEDAKQYADYVENSLAVARKYGG